MDIIGNTCCKRQRVSDNNDVMASSGLGSDAASPLLSVPREVLERILKLLDSASLLKVSQTCKAFRAPDNGMKLVEKIAREAVLESSGDEAERWRRRNWLSRLFIEDCNVGFANFQWSSAVPSAQEQGSAPQYRFLPATSPGSYLNIKLDGMGPKLLVSDLSTADQPVLRWRLAVRGNTAVEFGVVPLNMVEDDKSLHKCQQEEKKFEKLTGPLVDAERPTGFCSSITVGSMLPFKTAIMKGSVVELLARRGRLEILVQNPADGQELYWHNTRTVPKPYKGPREVRFEQDFSPHHDIKLALTSWAHGAFDVLHPAPGSRLLAPELQKAWELSSDSGEFTASRRGSKRRERFSDQQLALSDDDESMEAANEAAAGSSSPVAAGPTAAAGSSAAAQNSMLQHQAAYGEDQLQQQPKEPLLEPRQQRRRVEQPASDSAEHQTQGVNAAVGVQDAAVAAPDAAANVAPSSPPSDESTVSGEGRLL